MFANGAQVTPSMTCMEGLTLCSKGWKNSKLKHNLCSNRKRTQYSKHHIIIVVLIKHHIIRGLKHNLCSKGRKSQARRGLPGSVESSNTSGDNLSREIGCTIIVIIIITCVIVIIVIISSSSSSSICIISNIIIIIAITSIMYAC